jgi:hypothetical protein
LIREEQLGLLESLVLEVIEKWFHAMLPIVKQTHAINQSNAIDMCYMNAQKERESDSENFGTRITGFGVVVEKIWIFEIFGGIFVDFSEARDLFGIIFQITRSNCKFLDCGLILEKMRGLSAKRQNNGILDLFLNW